MAAAASSWTAILTKADVQACGVLAPFPIVFVIATSASALATLVLLQVTRSSLFVALGGFLVANSVAMLVGSRLGPLWESWHHRKVLISAYSPSSLSTSSLKNSSSKQYYQLPTKDLDENEVSEDEEEEVDEAARLTPTEGDIDNYVASRSSEPRSWPFFASLLLAVIVANSVGMLVGKWCATHFPSRFD